VDSLSGCPTSSHENVCWDPELVNELLQLVLYHLFELLVDLGVLELVLLLVVEDHAFFVNEVDDRILPSRRLQELGYRVKNPVLRGI